MKLEKLDYGNGSKSKYFLYGFIMCAVLLLIINFFTSKAKYKQVEKIELIRQNVNYSAPDLNIMGVFTKDEGDEEYTKLDDIPQTGYEFNKQDSYCTISNNPEHLKNIIDYQGGKITVETSKRNTKCYLYFDQKLPTAEDTLVGLGIDKVNEAPSDSEFNQTVCANNTNNDVHNSGNCNSSTSGLFKGTETINKEEKTTYYYRGTVDNNWVQFANKWWRIIRINGNGSIRLIYSGSNTSTKPSDGRWADKTDSQLSDTSAFNGTYIDNRYVGYMYGESTNDYTSTHTNAKESDIKIALDQWYQSNMTSYTDKLDGSAGFCNDREPYDGSSSSSKVDTSGHGYGSVQTYYGPYIKMIAKHLPSFDCTQKSNDLFTTKAEQGEGNGKLTYPVGLITADEVEFAGGKNANNWGYWLYTGQYYWTMSPYVVDGDGWADVFAVNHSGYLTYDNVNNTNGVRPVINLKAGTTFKYNNKETAGTINDPYVFS